MTFFTKQSQEVLCFQSTCKPLQQDPRSATAATRRVEAYKSGRPKFMQRLVDYERWVQNDKRARDGFRRGATCAVIIC